MNDESLDERELFNRVYDPRTFRIKNLMKDQKEGVLPAISLLSNHDETESGLSLDKHNFQLGSDSKNSDSGFSSDGSPFKKTGGLYSSCFNDSEAKHYTLKQTHNSLMESRLSSATTHSFQNTQKLGTESNTDRAYSVREDRIREFPTKFNAPMTIHDSFGTQQQAQINDIEEVSSEQDDQAGELSAERLQSFAEEKLNNVRRLSAEIISRNQPHELDSELQSQRSFSSRVRNQHRLITSQASAPPTDRSLNSVEQSPYRASRRNTQPAKEAEEEPESYYRKRSFSGSPLPSVRKTDLLIEDEFSDPQLVHKTPGSKDSKESEAFYSMKSGSIAQDQEQEQEPLKSGGSRKFVFSAKQKSMETTSPEEKPFLHTSFTLGKKPKLVSLPHQDSGLRNASKSRPNTILEISEQHHIHSPELSGIVHNETAELGSHHSSPAKIDRSSYWNESVLEQVNYSQSLGLLDHDKQVQYLESKCQQLNIALQRQVRRANNLEEEGNSTTQGLHEEISRLQQQLYDKDLEYQKQISLIKSHQKRMLTDQPNIVQDLYRKDLLLSEREKQITDLRSQLNELTKRSAHTLSTRETSRSGIPRGGNSKIYVEDELQTPDYDKENNGLLSNAPSTAASARGRPVDYENHISKLKKEVEFLHTELKTRPNAKTKLVVQEVVQTLSQPFAVLLLQIWAAMGMLKSEIRMRDEKRVLERADYLLDVIERESNDLNEEESDREKSDSKVLDLAIQLAMDISQRLRASVKRPFSSEESSSWTDVEAMYYHTESELFSRFEDRIQTHASTMPEAQDDPKKNMILQERSNANISMRPDQSFVSVLNEKQKTAMNYSTLDNRKENEQQSGTADLEVKELIFSDFSDDDFDNEDQEEKLAITAIGTLKAGVRESKLSNPEFNPIKQLVKEDPEIHLPGQKDHVFVDQLVLVLENSGISVPLKELIPLLLRLDQGALGTINIIQFLENIRGKNHLWWKNKIHNAHFDLKYKPANLGPLFLSGNKMKELIFRVISEKIQLFKQHNRLAEFECLSTFFSQTLLAANEEALMTKAGLRAFFRRHKFLFTRLETQIMLYLLEQNSSQSKSGIPYSDLKELLISEDVSRLYTKMQKEISGRTLRPRQQHDSEHVQKIVARLRSELTKLRSTDVKYSPTKIKDSFKLADKRFTGLLNYHQFNDVCHESEFPFEHQHELSEVFEYLAKEQAVRSPEALAKLEDNLFEHGRVQYDKFIDLLFQEEELVTAESQSTNLKNIQFTLKATEAKLKIAEQRLLELEGQTEKSSATIKKAYNVKAADQFSNERTLRLKVEDLEFENARLRQNCSAQDQKRKGAAAVSKYNSDSSQYRKTDISTEESFVHSNDVSIHSAKPKDNKVEDLARKLELVESNFLLKEMEFQSQLKLQQKTNLDKLQLQSKHFEQERLAMLKVIEGKNKEIEEYRGELEMILVEMEELRRQTYRAMA